MDRNTKKRSRTLCWKCKHTNAYECSWFNDFTPVEGWEAEPDEIRVTDHSNGKKIDRVVSSFSVKSCPNFEPIQPRKVDKVFIAADQEFDGRRARAKGVVQMKYGCQIATYRSLHEAETKTGVNHRCISAVARGQAKSAGGYQWKFLNKEDK